MARVKNGAVTKARHKKVLKQAKGYFGSKHRLYKTAKEQLMHSGQYAFRDRKQKKRDFRKLWITRINAACRQNDISYSRFIEGLTKAGVEINRKMLSEIAINDPKAFTDLVKIAKDGKAGKLTPATEVEGVEVTVGGAAKTAKKETKKENEELLEKGRSSINDEPEEEEVKVSSAEVSDKKVTFSFRALMCKLIDINLLCATGFIITFMLFPGASIKPQLFNLPIGWKINTIIFLFNVFDTIAKTLVGYLTPTKGKLYFFSFSRILLICSFYYVCYAETFNLLKPEIISYIVLVNVILLSITGGFVNSLSFALAPGQVQDEWKGKAGSSVSLSLIIGICLGSFSGIIFNNLIDFKVPIPVEHLEVGKKGNM